ncbi:MAG: transcriptional regulator [Acidobacteria bacterium]|nr:transcriptional regulator [Acidobacteriota bacterium]
MNDLHGTTFVFPPFRMDPNRRLLFCEERLLSLTPKEFDTLLVLVEAAGAVVNKEMLIARVWPDSYVGDGSLARNISVLRKSMGAEVIETVPRRGYRLTVPVTQALAASAPAASDPPEAGQVEPPPVKTAGSRWGSLRLRIGLAVAATFVVGAIIFAGRYSVVRRASAGSEAGHSGPIHSLVIEKVGGVDPLDEGFTMFTLAPHEETSLQSPGHFGYDRLRLASTDQFLFYRTLSDAEKDFAFSHDWKLTCVCAVNQGAVVAMIDFGRYKGAMRFDIVLLQEGDRYFVALTKQISPDFQWEQKLEFAGVADVVNPHTYELRYDHLRQAASLWIDGNEAASGYRGHRQFRENTGLNFGTVRYLASAQAEGVFRTVRFEAY